MRRFHRVVGGLVLFGAFVVVAARILGLFGGPLPPFPSVADGSGFYALGCLLAAAGLLIMKRVPDNRFAPWLVWIGFVGTILFVAGAYRGPVGESTVDYADAGFAFVATDISWFTFYTLLIVAIPIRFPTGFPSSGFYEVVGRVGFANVVLAGAPALWSFATGSLVHSTFYYLPFGILAVLAFAAIGSLFVRYRRATQRIRAQLRWFTFALVAAIAVQFIVVTGDTLGIFGSEGAVGFALISGSLFLVPVALVVSIVGYRLYEIDRIISRTVTYAVVAGLLTGAVALIAAVVGTRFQSSLMVAATTLGVAAVFSPLRRRVQTWVDRRFNRSRYDAERVMVEFAGSLRDLTAESQVVDGWLAVVSATMHPSAAGVWLRQVK